LSADAETVLASGARRLDVGDRAQMRARRVGRVHPSIVRACSRRSPFALPTPRVWGARSSVIDQFRRPRLNRQSRRNVQGERQCTRRRHVTFGRLESWPAVDRRTPELEASGVPNADLDRGKIEERQVDNRQIDNRQIDNGQIDKLQIHNGQTDEVTALRLEVEQLREALATRDMIWTAKAVIAATTGCSPQEAHELLVRQSQFEHRKLRDVALDLVKRHESSGRGG
jgi:hypothetical protein